MISLQDALTIFERKNSRGLRLPFDVTFCTAHRDAWRTYKILRDKVKMFPHGPEKLELINKMNALDLGGDVITLKNAVLSGIAPVANAAKGKKSPEKKSFSPNHFVNKTRNFKLKSNNEIRKAHLRLIVMVNGQEVTY